MTEEQITELKKHIGDYFWLKNGRANYGFLRGQIVLQDYNEVITFDVFDGKWIAGILPPQANPESPFLLQAMFSGDGDTPTEAYNDLLDTICEFAKDVGAIK